MMIRAEQIPKECFVAYQQAFKRGGGVGDALAAALNAWPDMQFSCLTVEVPGRKIILPMPQENTNEKV